MIENRLKVLRAERDWTQADLADRVGISRQAVISIEKYKYNPVAGAGVQDRGSLRRFHRPGLCTQGGHEP